jgi:hypothetical protein
MGISRSLRDEEEEMPTMFDAARLSAQFTVWGGDSVGDEIKKIDGHFGGGGTSVTSQEAWRMMN